MNTATVLIVMMRWVVIAQVRNVTQFVNVKTAVMNSTVLVKTRLIHCDVIMVVVIWHMNAAMASINAVTTPTNSTVVVRHRKQAVTMASVSTQRIGVTDMLIALIKVTNCQTVNQNVRSSNAVMVVVYQHI
jgi:hypothetical protein